VTHTQHTGSAVREEHHRELCKGGGGGPRISLLRLSRDCKKTFKEEVKKTYEFDELVTLLLLKGFLPNPIKRIHRHTEEEATRVLTLVPFFSSFLRLSLSLRFRL